MKTTANTKFKTVDEYLSAVPPTTRSILQKLRKTIKQESPRAEEVVSYNIPAFKLNGILVFYAAHRDHIGFYPTPSGIEAFKKELSDYEGAKGSIKFPIDKPIPFALISKIVKFRMQENLRKAGAKEKKKK